MITSRTLFTRSALPAAFACLAPIAAAAQTLPGTVTSSGIGNSFMNVEGNQWVPDNVSDICVTPDGTVFTAGYAESGGGGAWSMIANCCITQEETCLPNLTPPSSK